MKKFLLDLPHLLKLAYQGWKEDRASRLAAALAYYTVFSLAPLLVIIIAITGLIWQRDVVQTQLLNQIQGLVGADGAGFVAGLITSASSPAKDVTATIIGIITLLIGALGVFNELHNSLSFIWKGREEKTRSFLQAVKKIVIDRLLSFTMILGIGFLLLVSLVISAGVSATQEVIGNAIPASELILQLVNLVISIGVITVLFALIYKFLPSADIPWQDIWVGAFVTSIFFSLGKMVIGLYLGNSAIASSFGAAGSLVLLLVWIYYSAQIIFFGAEFTKVYAKGAISKIVVEGREDMARTELNKIQDTKRKVIPVTSSVVAQRESQPKARFVVGLMAASFITGMMTTIFGIKRK